MPMASENPRRKTAASSASNPRVISMVWFDQASGMNGFSTRCAVASAADSVMVIRKSVAAKPSSARTSSLPSHLGSSRSSIAIDPSPR